MRSRYLAQTIRRALRFSIMSACAWLGTACDSESKDPGATSATASAQPAPPPEPPPDPHRNDYKKPTVEGKVAFDGLDAKKVNKLKGQSFVGMIGAELKFSIEGMTTAEEGPVKVNTGHFFVIIDGEPVEEAKEVTEDGSRKKFGKGELSGTIPLKEGKHRLTLQFVDARDRSYGPKWATTVEVDASAK